MRRARPPTDEVPTEIYDSGERLVRSTDAATKIGKRPQPAGSGEIEIADPTDHNVDLVEIADPTEKTREPILVISMKTPAEVAAEKHDKRDKVLPVPQLRPMADVRAVPEPAGNLARPRERSWHSRRVLANIGWGIAVIAIATVVAIALWFVMQRR